MRAAVSVPYPICTVSARACMRVCACIPCLHSLEVCLTSLSGTLPSKTVENNNVYVAKTLIDLPRTWGRKINPNWPSPCPGIYIAGSTSSRKRSQRVPANPKHNVNTFVLPRDAQNAGIQAGCHRVSHKEMGKALSVTLVHEKVFFVLFCFFNHIYVA